MIPSNLNSQEILQGGFTHKFIVTHADLTTTANNTAEVENLFSGLVLGSIVGRVGYRVVTAFSGGAASAVTMSLGDGASATRWATTVDVFTGTAVAVGVSSAAAQAYLAAGLIKATFITDAGHNVDGLTAGEVHIYAEIIDTTKL